MWVVKRATSLLNSFCSNVAKQVACFLLPVFPYLKKLLYLFKVVLSTSKHLQASFQGSKRTDVPHTNCTTQKKIAKLQNNNIIFWGNREKRDDKHCKTWPKPANRCWCLSEEGIYHYRVDRDNVGNMIIEKEFLLFFFNNYICFVDWY